MFLNKGRLSVYIKFRHKDKTTVKMVLLLKGHFYTGELVIIILRRPHIRRYMPI